jgi:hypothetical protein
MALPYRYWVQRLATAPLDGYVGRKLSSLWGLIGDMIAGSAQQAVLARSMRSATHPADALRLTGFERGMPRYAGESDIVYRARLLGAWQAWTQAGTARAVESQLRLAGFFGAKVIERWEWNWDSNAFDWSRFWVVIPRQGHPYTPWQLGEDTVLSRELVIGLDLSPSVLALIRSIIRKWKPAHMRCEYIVFVVDAERWPLEQPAGNWDVAGNRTTSAAFVVGT